MAHFEIGRILSESRDPNAVTHMRSSFTSGDNNYEAQFWYARELFLQKHFDEAKEVFNNLHTRAPSRFRRVGGIPVKRDKNLVEYEVLSYARKTVTHSWDSPSFRKTFSHHRMKVTPRSGINCIGKRM